MANTSISNALLAVYNGLNDRQKEVITGRFGLQKSGEIQTLETLGRKFGVTRERIRQIEVSALTALRTSMASEKTFSDLVSKSKLELKNAGGVITRDELLARLCKQYPEVTHNHVSLVLAVTKEFYFYPDDKDFNAYYFSDKTSQKKATDFIVQWVSSLRNDKIKIVPAGYETKLKSFVKAKNTDPFHAKNFLAITKKIHSNPFGDVGLSEWAEIKPRTIRDRVYLVLKKKGEPVHFEKIAGLVNEARFDSHIAIASTVHNELIKDQRFVLVGRGMYGLAEHGYERGTAREVMQKILQKHGPLKSKEIVLALQKERFFKHNTILVNLQNRNYFERLSDGTYKVREA